MVSGLTNRILKANGGPKISGARSSERTCRNKCVPYLGFTGIGANDRDTTVMVDCDEMLFRVTKKLSLIVMWKCRLDGFIILRSSKNHYHVVFDCPVSWTKNMSAVAWFSVLSHNAKVKDYLVMQCLKEAPTLRVGMKGEKPSPRVVYRYGEQRHAVKEFLRYRQRIKGIEREIFFYSAEEFADEWQSLEEKRKKELMASY